MCIICNTETTNEAQNKADEFLTNFGTAGLAMQKAATSMHDLLPNVIDEEARIRYDHTHKKMVKLIKEWNSIEHEREKKQHDNWKKAVKS